MLRQLLFLLKLSRSSGIVRRYFIVNGFDGALTMLGLLVGFFVGDEKELGVIIAACAGAAIALGMSGFSSAYISESAEKQKELRELERAMMADLSSTAHGKARIFVPLWVAFVNGAAPLIVSLFTLTPLWLANRGTAFGIEPLFVSISVAFSAIFLLGVFLGNLSQQFWLYSGLRTVLIAGVTCGIILLLPM